MDASIRPSGLQWHHNQHRLQSVCPVRFPQQSPPLGSVCSPSHSSLYRNIFPGCWRRISRQRLGGWNRLDFTAKSLTIFLEPKIYITKKNNYSPLVVRNFVLCLFSVLFICIYIYCLFWRINVFIFYFYSPAGIVILPDFPSNFWFFTVGPWPIKFHGFHQFFLRDVIPVVQSTASKHSTRVPFTWRRVIVRVQRKRQFHRSFYSQEVAIQPTKDY